MRMVRETFFGTEYFCCIKCCCLLTLCVLTLIVFPSVPTVSTITTHKQQKYKIDANVDKKPARNSRHASIAETEDSKEPKIPHIPMDESAHTFAPALASQSGHHSSTKRGNSPVMITDALKDVRVNYHIDPKEVGHGHYGVVRKCMHRETGEWYAIKSIRKSKVSKIEVLKREIEILKEVKHPHIIELIEVYEDERYLHLITELCTGGELFDRIIAKTQSAEGHFSEHDAAVLVRDILDAIRYCHDEKGIVHRDLKPENFLFLTEADDAPVKIIDFGLSRHDDTDLGIMQTKVGTPYYVAPEVLRREYTKSCDIWSIGVISYILLCGYPPFYGDSDTQIFESVRVGRFDFPSPEWDDISESAKDFVIEMLKKNPTDRCGKSLFLAVTLVFEWKSLTLFFLSHVRPTATEALRHKWLREQLGIDESKTSRRESLTHRSVRTGAFTNYLAMKKLKKAALGYIASKLTHEEVGTLEATFRSMDKKGKGLVSLKELDEAITRGNFSENILEDLRELKTDLAISGEQQLDWRDFVAMTMDRSIALREDNIKMAFEHFGHTDAEYLTIDDLATIFGGKAQAREVMGVLDTDRDGKVSFEDFRHALVESMDEDTEIDESCHNGVIS